MHIWTGFIRISLKDGNVQNLECRRNGTDLTFQSRRNVSRRNGSRRNGSRRNRNTPDKQCIVKIKQLTPVQKPIEHFFNCRNFILGARHFVESHFVGTTFGRIRLLVDVTFRRVRHSVEKNIQVRHFVEMVNSIIF